MISFWRRYLGYRTAQTIGDKLTLQIELDLLPLALRTVEEWATVRMGLLRKLAYLTTRVNPDFATMAPRMMDRPGLLTDVSALMGMDEVAGGSIDVIGCANEQGVYFGIAKSTESSSSGGHGFVFKYFFQTAPGELQSFVFVNHSCAVEDKCFPGESYPRFPENASVASVLRNETYPVVLLPNISNFDPRVRVWYTAALSEPNPDPYKIVYAGIFWPVFVSNQVVGTPLVGFSARVYPSVSSFSQRSASRSTIGVRSSSCRAI